MSVRAAIVPSDWSPSSPPEQTTATFLARNLQWRLSIVRIFFFFFFENRRVNAGVTKGCIIYHPGETVVGKWLSSPGGQRSEWASELHPLVMQRWGRSRNDPIDRPLASNVWSFWKVKVSRKFKFKLEKRNNIGTSIITQLHIKCVINIICTLMCKFVFPRFRMVKVCFRNK